MIEFIKNRFQSLTSKREEKASIGLSQMMIGMDHSYAMKGIKEYAIEGYMSNPTVFACINLIATSFARVPLRVVDDEGEEFPDSAFQRLMDRPNPDEGGDEFRTASASWQLLTGNCFTERMMTGGAPRELWNWQPYEMSVGRQKGSRLPSRYVFMKDRADQKQWDVDVINGTCDMLHWRSFNPSPNDSTMGMPPLAAAAQAADSYNSAMKWRYNQSKNGGTLDGIISAKSPNTMDDNQVNGLKRALREKWRGSSKAGERLGVSSAELTFTSLSTSLRDAEWLGGTKLNKQEICEVYRVPTQLLGIEGSQTYANFEQATKALYYLAVIPLLDLYCSEMNRWLGSYFPGQYLTYNESDIGALETDRAERRTQKINSGAYSINEIRREFGDIDRDEPEADAVLTDPNKIPLGMDVFAGLDSSAGDVAKALMRAGIPRMEAETKAMEWLHDRTI